jgi:hypothetical protein
VSHFGRFHFGSNTQDLFYGFPPNEIDFPGRMRVGADFVTKAITDPSQRTYIPDPITIVKTKDFVAESMQWLDATDAVVPNATCLASMLPDGGFVLSLAPKTDRVAIFTAGWGNQDANLSASHVSDRCICYLLVC